MGFQLVPISIALNDIERPWRTSSPYFLGARCWPI